MLTETSSGLRQRTTHSPPEEMQAREGQGVRLQTSHGNPVDAKIALDETSRLREICVHLRDVRKLTDPVVMKPRQCSMPTKEFFLRDSARREAAFKALDEFATVKTTITAYQWFCVFVLLDKLGPKEQLRSLSAYLSVQTRENGAEWALEVMRHWLIRRSTADNAALRTGAISHLIGFWKTFPEQRPATAELLAYLLCADPDIGRPILASHSDWTAVLKLLPKSGACEEAGTALHLSDPEVLVAAGLLQAARNFDERVGDDSSSAYLSLRLGKDLERAVPNLGSLNTFAVMLRRAESKSPKAAIYQLKLSAYEEEEKEREARVSAIWAGVKNFFNVALEVAVPVLKVVALVILAVFGIKGRK